MKRSFLKPIAVFLMIVLLLPSVVLPTYADASAPIENLYDAYDADVGTAPDTVGKNPVHSELYYTSGAIEVSEGDTITVGPVLQGEVWFMRTYGSNGKDLGKIYTSQCTEEILQGNAVIATYTIPAGVSDVRVTTARMFGDALLITRNRPFTKDEYLSYMDAEGIDAGYLKRDAYKSFSVSCGGNAARIRKGGHVHRVELLSKPRLRRL